MMMLTFRGHLERRRSTQEERREGWGGQVDVIGEAEAMAVAKRTGKESSSLQVVCSLCPHLNR